MWSEAYSLKYKVRQIAWLTCNDRVILEGDWKSILVIPALCSLFRGAICKCNLYEYSGSIQSYSTSHTEWNDSIWNIALSPFLFILMSRKLIHKCNILIQCCAARPLAALLGLHRNQHRVPVFDIISPLTTSGTMCVHLLSAVAKQTRAKKRNGSTPYMLRKQQASSWWSRGLDSKRMAALECRCNHRGQEALKSSCFSQMRVLRSGRLTALAYFKLNSQVSC